MKGSNESDRMKKQKKIDKDKHTDFKWLWFISLVHKIWRRKEEGKENKKKKKKIKTTSFPGNFTVRNGQQFKIQIK